MKLTPTEINHILRLLKNDAKEGAYYCIREQYENRADRIIKKLEAELRHLKEIKREAKI